MELARLHHRILAHFIDSILISLIFIIVLSFFLNSLKTTKISVLLILPILGFLYFIIMEYKLSCTIGKKLVGIRVISLNKNSISLKQSFIRNILRIIDGFPMYVYIVAIIIILLNKKNQRLGDILAKTIVVKIR